MQANLEYILLAVSKSSFIDEGNLDRAARLILSSVIEGLGVQRAGIWLFDDERKSIRCQLLFDFGTKTEIDDIVLTRKDFPKYFKALDGERNIRADNALTDPSTGEFVDVYLNPLGITSMLDTPIRHRGEMIGIICSEHTGLAREWTDDEVTFAGSLSDLYGRAVSAAECREFEIALQHANSQLEEKIQARTAELQKALSDLQKAQKHLVESEKMAALGSLVAGVAHEVNTPLGVAITSVSHIDELVQQLEKQYHAGLLDEDVFLAFLRNYRGASILLHTNMDRAARLVSDFKQTAVDQGSDVLEGFSPAAHLKRLVSSLHPIYKQKNARVSLNIPDDARLQSYPGALSQIITNLVANSCMHAFDETGQNEISVHGCLEGDYFILHYQDNGKGMSAAIRQRVFEPFFTTNRAGGGSGLGMSIVYNLVVQKLLGEIDFQGAEGEGVRVTIKIPAQHPYQP
ncbi:MAG: GAF domain-containing sensor histidine kinase [Hahellaceae bacterium]|nr:GAF domain-containing sensor histidine kinase [Hahellaceae bacterium]MCP5211976.1 GAF domain-containing sensor histidine kinase [Hahellaceae bacterium]